MKTMLPGNWAIETSQGNRRETKVANRITLSLETRTIMGKQVKKLRKAGTVPVHLYGPSISPRFLQCATPDLLRVLVQAGSNAPVFVTLPDSGEEHLAFVREVQWDPLRGTLLHVDLLQTELSQRLAAEVPIVLEGESQAAREAGGTVGQVLRTLSVEALPLDMPGDIRVDVSVLTDDSNVLRAGDVSLPGNVTLLTDPEEMVARIELPVRAEEAVVEESEGAASEQTEEEGE